MFYMAKFNWIKFCNKPSNELRLLPDSRKLETNRQES